MLHIMDAELFEGNYVLYQGDLSTNYVCCWEKLMHPEPVLRFRAFVAWAMKISENADHPGPHARL
ncbi:hypothetical protein AFK24_15330 [Pseudomonas syringae]|uniref:Uncharacterized protein n=1 Tax=Pseudomonas syringae TaxID=317 RepID=A0A085VLV5_PSESX|nr:hypothetical protein CFII64_07600 [Pseudomonas sp. CFII64]KFE56418.1 hypothetical protein IV02_00855 [Pseudomonas syringae]OCR24135.1 hypothetical protein AFK24_15330 [Pseudomonas syringae]